MAFLDETGLTHLWTKITNKFLAKSSVANNLTTTSEGYALDARQAPALLSAIKEGQMKLESVSGTVVKGSSVRFSHPAIITACVQSTARGSYLSLKDNNLEHASSLISLEYNAVYTTIAVTKDSILSVSGDGQIAYFGFYIE